MSKTSEHTENFGNVIYSIEWTTNSKRAFETNKRAFIEADSASFIVKGHPNVQPGDLCLRGYKKNLLPREDIEYSREYKLAGR